MRLLVPNLFVPGHVVSELRLPEVRFSGFPFEWDMAYNNLPSTTVQAVIKRIHPSKILVTGHWCKNQSDCYKTAKIKTERQRKGLEETTCHEAYNTIALYAGVSEQQTDIFFII
jgi:hypothetical protein